MNAIQDIRMASGEVTKARYVRHLRTLTTGSGCTSGRNKDVELYRTVGGRLVVCISDAIDCRCMPEVDPDVTPADYGISED